MNADKFRASPGNPEPTDGSRDGNRTCRRQEVFSREVSDPLLGQLADDVRVPLEEVHAEAVVLHAVKFRGDLGIPLEGDDERADLILLAIANLLEGEGLRPQAIHLRANRFDRLPQIRGVHARRDGPHAARGPRVEARERVVGEALFIPEVPAEAAVQADPPKQEVRQVQRIVVLVKRDDVPPPDPSDPGRIALGLPAVRMVLREDKPGHLPDRAVVRVVRFDAEVVLQFRADPLDLLRWERRLGEAIDQDPDRFRRRLARAPPLEGQDLVSVPEFEGRADPLEAIRELRGAHPARPAEQQPRGELGQAELAPLGRDPGGHRAPDRDERVRGQRDRQEDRAVLQDGPVREVHRGTSWAWNRTTVRCSSTRYRWAAARTCSGRTLSTFARSASAKSHAPRPSPALSNMPWKVTPSCSYRAQARTCWWARASSDFGGGARFSFSISRSSTASTRSREAPGASVAFAMSREGSSFDSRRTPTSVASFASTRARYSRFDRGRQSPAANGTNPRHPPRTVARRTSAGVSSWAAPGMCQPTERRSAGPGRSRSLLRSPRCSGSASRRGSGGRSGCTRPNASRVGCIATATSNPPTRIRDALFGA